jgi:hypothetical protein
MPRALVASSANSLHRSARDRPKITKDPSTPTSFLVLLRDVSAHGGGIYHKAKQEKQRKGEKRREKEIEVLKEEWKVLEECREGV